MPYSNNDLITAIKLKAALPENNSEWSDQTILNLANEVMRDTLLPVLIKLRQEYYVFPETITLSNGTSKYRVNPRFVGSAYRDLQLLDGTNLINLPQISPEEASSTASGRPRSFYMQGNSLVIYPTPDNTYTVNATGYIRPSDLTEVSNCCEIQSIDSNNNQVTVDAIPTGWTTGTVVDWIKGTPGYEILSIDSSITNASGVTLTFSSLPTGLEVGDYLAPQRCTPVPNIPEEFMSILTEYSAQKCLKSLGLNEEAQVAGESASNLLKNTVDMLTPRVIGGQKKFKTRLV